MSPQLDGHYEIAFNASDRKSWKKYAKLMEEQLRCESDTKHGGIVGILINLNSNLQECGLKVS